MQKSLLHRFNIYQKERFPLSILTFTTLAVLLSSAAILYYQVTLFQFFVTFLAVIVYLFHMRVIDERRDFGHDTQYHNGRPVQRGIISLKELEKLDILGLLLFFGIAIVFGLNSITIAVATVTYTYVASKDFFLGETIRKNFFLYNIANMVQMILLQLFIYVIFTSSLNVNLVMWLHLFFVLVNSVIIEVVRKIKIKSEESMGQDTYSGLMGFNNSLIMCSILVVLNYLLFLGLLYLLTQKFLAYFIVSIPLILFLLAAVLFHTKKRVKASENIFLLAAFFYYVGLNLVIYFFNSI